jgi:hypothetical protein
MKKIIILSLFILAGSLLSCTADSVAQDKNQQVNTASAIGPGDEPIAIKPPPR